MIFPIPAMKDFRSKFNYHPFPQTMLAEYVQMRDGQLKAPLKCEVRRAVSPGNANELIGTSQEIGESLSF